MHRLATGFGFPWWEEGVPMAPWILVVGRLPRFALSVEREDEP